MRSITRVVVKCYKGGSRIKLRSVSLSHYSMDKRPGGSRTIQLSSGNPMPLIGLGCFFGPGNSVCYEDAQRTFENAIDTGYRHFDGASVYNTEIPLGRAINTKIKAGMIKREDLYVTTKLAWDSHHPGDARESFQQSLQNLGLEYVDLYLIHWPAPVKKNPKGPLFSRPLDEENDYITVWKVLEDLVKKGQVRAIGLSNFNSRQVENILHQCTIKPVVNQCEVHFYYQNKELIEHNAARGVKVVGYAPLGIGHTSSNPDWEVPLNNQVVLDLAQKYKKSPGQIALKFLVQQGIPVIPSSNNPQHQADNFDIFSFEIQDEDMHKLRSLDQNKKLYKLSALKNHKEYPFSEPF